MQDLSRLLKKKLQYCKLNFEYINTNWGSYITAESYLTGLEVLMNQNKYKKKLLQENISSSRYFQMRDLKSKKIFKCVFSVWTESCKIRY